MLKMRTEAMSARVIRLGLGLLFGLGAGGLVDSQLFVGQAVAADQAVAERPVGVSSQGMSNVEAISDVFRQVSRRAGPAVVHIYSRVEPKKADREKSPRSVDPSDLPEALRRFFEDREDGQRSPRFQFRLPEEIQPQPQIGSGSGVIIDAEKGYVITNNHVVEGIEKDKDTGRIDVRLADGRRFLGQIVGKDPKTDLALIQIKGDRLQALPLGDSSKVEVGDFVMAIGAPFNLDQTVTQGIISAKGRNPRIVEGYEDFIQTDAAINPGNSGGPLVNMRGEVIGINTAIVTRGMVAAYAGVGFAIPSQTVKELLPYLQEGKEIVRGYLGVAIQGFDTAPPGYAKTFGLEEEKGVVVEEVMSGTPAAKAGLKADDVILTLAGEPVKSVQTLQSKVARTTPGTKMELKVWRDKKEITIPVVIEKQPKQFFAQDGGRRQKDTERDAENEGDEGETEIEALAISVQPATPSLAKKLGWSDPKEVEGCLLVTGVETLGEGAAGMGIEVGDAILSVQGEKVTTGRALQKALSRENLEKGVRLRVKSVRTGRSRSLFEQLPQ